MIRFESQRRLFLLKSLLLGLAVFSKGCASPAIRQGIHQMDSTLQVDGHSVGPEAIIRPGNTVTTGVGGVTVLVMGQDAFLLGEKTSLFFHPRMTAMLETKTPADHIAGITGFTLNAGRILSVFGSGSKTLKLPSAVIGIRGTGIFLQVEPEQDYMCLCYGLAEVRMNGDAPVSPILVEAKHHDAPCFLSAGKPMRTAPMLHHTDEELFMLEALVDRQPPFGPSLRKY